MIVTEGFGQDLQRLAEYFYSYDRLLVSMRETRLQREFDTLTELFKRLGLRTNLDKIVSMACQPYHTLGGQSAEVYGLWMTR